MAPGHHGPALVNGVVSELNEEINDAYDDLIEDIGITEAEEADLPPCLPLLICDYIFLNIASMFSKKPKCE